MLLVLRKRGLRGMSIFTTEREEYYPGNRVTFGSFAFSTV